MEWQLTDKEYEAVIQTPAEIRYEYLIKRTAGWEVIWSLASDDGWVLLGDGEGHECVPVWPHSRYAEACVADNWADTSPQAIEIHEWLELWLPGLEKDNSLVAVFPTSQLNALVVTPSQMRDDLLEELDKYE